ncbi:oxidoreductase [Peribacillus asahii]|uniref:oxidoreductase n=1 Tax=Peribacillus asahii TaxID=228899 RepID=UPI0020796505|nr:oxidoreductase [Peribacillus asahii]USK68899.1 oxidoreductase [Peribacillus asahii]
MNTEKRKALIVGATGLVGNELLRILLQSNTYENVKALVRKPISIKHPKLTQRLVDFNALEKYEEEFAVYDVFCCLGTTIKKAGSQEAFKKVDFEYPLKAAKLAKKKGANQFLIISAMGANSQSRIFYNRVKGVIEEALKQVQLPSLHIFRPSLLLGKRNEFRLGERFAEMVSPIFLPLLIGKLRKYKPIQAKDVAQAMYQIAKQNRKGEFVYESNQILNNSKEI